MKLECTIKRGGIPPTDFFMLLNKVGAVIDVIATSEPQLSRSSWRMKGYSLEAAQSRGATRQMAHRARQQLRRCGASVPTNR